MLGCGTVFCVRLTGSFLFFSGDGKGASAVLVAWGEVSETGGSISFLGLAASGLANAGRGGESILTGSCSTRGGLEGEASSAESASDLKARICSGLNGTPLALITRYLRHHNLL